MGTTHYPRYNIMKNLLQAQYVPPRQEFFAGRFQIHFTETNSNSPKARLFKIFNKQKIWKVEE